jgi:hypothetical protein
VSDAGSSALLFGIGILGMGAARRFRLFNLAAKSCAANGGIASPLQSARLVP